ncbi:MAG: FtsB family cell division protein [Bacillota bacterium]
MRSKRYMSRLAAQAAGAPVSVTSPVAPERLPKPLPETAVAPKTARKKASLPWFFVGVLFVAVTVAFVFRQAEVMAVQRALSDMERQIEHYKALNKSLEEQIAALKSDEYIEKAAREKLGLVKPGEVQYMVIDYETEDVKPTP